MKKKLIGIAETVSIFGSVFLALVALALIAITTSECVLCGRPQDKKRRGKACEICLDDPSNWDIIRKCNLA